MRNSRGSLRFDWWIVSAALFSVATIAWVASAQRPIYRCVAVIAPNIIELERLGEVKLIGVQPPHINTPWHQRSIDTLTALALGKELELNFCSVLPKDDSGRLRVIASILKDTKNIELNTKLISLGWATIVDEPECHVNVNRWQRYVLAATNNKLGQFAPAISPLPWPERIRVIPVPRSGVAGQTEGMEAFRKLRQTEEQIPKKLKAAANVGVSTMIRDPERSAERLMVVGPAFRGQTEALGEQVGTAYAQLETLRAGRKRAVILESEMRKAAVAKPVSSERVINSLVNNAPSELAGMTAPFAGGQVLKRLERLHLTDRLDQGEDLHKVLSWFPDIRNEMEGRLASLGSQICGGPAISVGMASSGSSSAGRSGGSTGTYYQLLGKVRSGQVLPEHAAIYVLALVTYRPGLEDEIKQAELQVRRAVETTRESQERIDRELKKAIKRLR